MKAIVQDGYGSPDVLRLREVGMPTIGDDGVLVKVHAASLNALDLHMVRSRLPQLIGRIVGVPASRVRGRDVAGRVEAIGKNVLGFKPGDEVFGTAIGSLAAYAASTEKQLARKPQGVTFEQAASLPIAGLTALQGLRDAGGLVAGQRVLINGAGGGVGTFAVQVAKALGAHVTAVTSTRNVDLVRSIGADEVVDYTKDDFTRGNRRHQILFNLGGSRSLRDCRRVLAPDGVIVLAGVGGGPGGILARLVEARVRRLAGQRFPSFIARVRSDDLALLGEFVASGKVAPVIERVYPLGDAPEALRALATGAVRGKLVIAVA